MKYIVAQLGARRNYAVPTILYKHKMLARLHTDICGLNGLSKKMNDLPELFKTNFVKKIISRRSDNIPQSFIHEFIPFGTEYFFRLSFANSYAERMRIYNWAGTHFNKLIIKSGIYGADAIYGYNGAALKLFTYANQQNLYKVLEQTIAPHLIESEILKDEYLRYPEWNESLYFFNQKFSETEFKEWNLSDLIICGSKFVYEGIRKAGGPIDRCVVIPNASSLPVPISFSKEYEEKKLNKIAKKQLNVLTVGEVSLRKGTQYIFDAAKNFNAIVKFRLVGPINVSGKLRDKLSSILELKGPVPRSLVHKDYEWADVYLLPSLCEGSAGSVYEALSFGLPVICTENTGSIVRNGEDGFIIPIKDSKCIVDKINQFLDEPDLIAKMSNNAKASFYNQAQYEHSLIKALNKN
jgi:glycosyltransferase involved in cell wall biosynthesis